MKSTNPELVYLYRQYSYCQKRRIPIPCDIQRSIDELQGSPVILSTITQNKEQQLRETIGNFEQLLKEGITKAEAARRLGYDYPTIWKMYETLKRIESERKTGRELQVSSWEGDPFPCRQSFISAHYAENIAIVGQGIIDGNAVNADWWVDVKKRKIGRPKLVFLNQCRNVTFHGILGRNSACWNFHPFFSKGIYFYHTAVEAPKDSPNTDGTDPESCDDVRYIGMRFSVGDDAIAIKAGKVYMGMKYQTPATNHLVRNCLMEYAHGAMVLGSEMSGGVKDLTVSQCYFKHTDRGLRIKTRRGRGKYAVIDGVEFSNIKMENVMTPLVMNMYYFCDPDGHEEIVWSKEPHPIDDGTPYLGSFLFRDMECTDCEWAAGYFYGLTEQPIGHVAIENVSFTFKEDASSGMPAMMDYIDPECRRGLYFNCVKKVSLKNVTMSGQNGDRLTTIQVDEVIDQ